MNPYVYVKSATDQGESLLSLCCGIGFELSDLNTQDVTAVDVAQQYIERVPERCPQAKLVLSDVLSYLKKQKPHSVDVISMIDGLEHLDKHTGLEVIKQMKRVTKKQILLFVPQGLGQDGLLSNHPHDAWGISGADKYQEHISGWTDKELQGFGFTELARSTGTSQHGEPYIALMYQYRI